jgi:antirestriction protein ArdC
MKHTRTTPFHPIKADEIKAKTDAALDALMADLQQGRSESLTKYLAVMGKFHNYSFGNQMLIAMQRPEATHVAGFRAWTRFNRHVKKGEHGIMILAPLVGRRKDEEIEEAEASRVFGFKAAYVFDISQTDGEPLPEFAKVTGDPEEYLDRLKTLVTREGIALLYDDSIRPALGVSQGGTIRIAEGLEPAEEFSTLTHELAHEKLHRSPERRNNTNRTIRETEAEATAFVVCQAIGLETGTAALDYIKLYNGDRETLKASLEFIQSAAQTILKGIQHEGASEGEGDDKESPHQARGSQKLTAENASRGTTCVTLQQKIIE